MRPHQVTITLAVVAAVAAVAAAAEHKVHNIVLYPERHSWCQTTPIKQVVAMPGYEPLTIDNHVCVGACYSYSIPRTQPAEPGELIGPYCDSCQPKATQCYHVTLRRSPGAGGGGSGADEVPMRKRVQIITECSCSSCGGNPTRDDCDLEDENTSELPASLVAAKDSQERAELSTPEVPELMAVGSEPISLAASSGLSASAEIPQGTGSGTGTGTGTNSYFMVESTHHLLKLIQNDKLSEQAEEKHHEEMRKLLDLVQGPDGNLSDRDVVDFVNWANDHDDMELDALKLKEALNNFHRRELRQRHRKFGLGPSASIPDGIEGSHLGLGHKKGAHIGMGITSPKLIDDNIIPSEDGADDDEVGLNLELPASGEEHHHAHKIGDAMSAGGSVAHLVMGPHGSLVLAAPENQERLSLASDEVQANHEGAVIDYHHHHHHHHHHAQRSTPAPL